MQGQIFKESSLSMCADSHQPGPEPDTGPSETHSLGAESFLLC